MRTTPDGIKLIKHFEQCVLKPYRCPAGVATIGWGSTYYEDGRPVTMQDRPLTQAQADGLFLAVLSGFERSVANAVKPSLFPYQFDALVSFAYNVGAEAFRRSTLCRLVNVNPLRADIPAEFLRWNKADGKVLKGLSRRRTIEAYLYRTGKLLIA